MSSIAKTSISLSKKDLTKSRISTVSFSNVVFYHKATAGQKIINLASLTLPSAEMPTVVQATPEELGAARLSVNKKNLRLSSSAKGELIQGLDYVVVDSMTILLIGPYEDTGAEIEEIFVGTVTQVPVSDLVVASSKNVVKSYSLPVGQNTLNLAQEFKVNEFSSENIGIVKLFVNGVLAQRNTGNSSTILDKDYYEIDSGNGFGSTIYFNTAPSLTPYEIIADFGVRAVTDLNAIGTIESLSGSIKKIANDLAPLAGTSASSYINSNPSDVERRGFGDMVLNHETRVSTVEAILPSKANINGSSANLFSVANATAPANAVALGQFDAALSANGYQRLPSGLIIQWGTTGSIAPSSGLTITLPIANPTATVSVSLTQRNLNDRAPGVINVTNSGFEARNYDTGGTITCYWMAIGY